MFLDWIAQLELLQHDSQTNILESLPLSIRRTLISEITTFLHPTNVKHPPDPTIFSSPAHVKWYMEVIGQGFSLPLEDMHITNDDISIYSQWLLEPAMRPTIVSAEGLEQEFFQIIFHQYSLLFESRVFRPVNIYNIPQYQSSQLKNINTATTTAYDNENDSISFSQQQLEQLKANSNIDHSTNDSSHTTHTQHNILNNNLHLSTLPVNVHNNVMPFSLPIHLTSAPQTTASSIQNNSQHHQSNISKDNIAALVQRHIDLCKKTLTVISTAGRSLQLSSETWTALLKVMLGITDSLLKEPSGEPPIPGVKNMSDELCEPLLRVLFELWLRSRNIEIDMWDMLSKCFSRWTHRTEVIRYWSSTSLSLTNRIINILYGKEEGTSTVLLTAGTNSIKLDLPHDIVKYAWHRILYLLQNPAQLSSSNFVLAMKGVGKVIDVLNTVGLHHSIGDHAVSVPKTTTTSYLNIHNAVNNSNSSSNSNNDGSINSTIDAMWTDVEPPDGNTILNMFGTMIFDSVALTTAIDDIDRQIGCAESFKILCKIFCRPQRRNPFLRTYLERFYAALSLGLKSDICLSTILVNGTELFVTDLEGIRMLVPDFIAASKMIIPKLKIDVKASQVPVDVLRLSTLKIIATIMCLPNHYENVTLKEGWEWDMQCSPENTTTLDDQDQLVSKLIRLLYEDQIGNDVERPYTKLKFYILELLIMAFRTESSSYNMRYILHLINIYVVEDVPFCPGLVGMILTMQLPSEVTLVAFDVLMDFVDLFEYVKRDSKNFARELVLALSTYVDTLINAKRWTQSYPLIVQAYDCMIKWVLVSQWIIDDKDCYQAVIATLSKGITIFEKSVDTATPPSEKKKRRDTTFTPTKQLFQLQPKANRAASSSASSTSSTPSSSSSQQNNSNNNSTQQLHRKEEIAIRMAAEYCMSQFVNHLGRSPFGNKLTFRDTRWSIIMDDLQLLRQHQNNKSSAASTPTIETSELNSNSNNNNNNNIELCNQLRYFLLDSKLILTIIDITKYKDDKSDNHLDTQTPATLNYFSSDTHGKNNNDSSSSTRNTPSLICIIRDTTGKYIWSMQTQYIDPRQQYQQITRSQITDHLAPPPLSPLSPSSYSHTNNAMTRSPSSTSLPQFVASPQSIASTEQTDYFHRPFNISTSSADSKICFSQVTTPSAVAVNNDDIPHLDYIFDKKSENWKQWMAIKKLAENQQEAEQKSLKNKLDKPLDSYNCVPTGPNIDTDSAKAFRLILSQIGYMLPQNRHHITPLRLNDNLLTELEGLDKLNARECISISVYYAQSGNTSWNELVDGPKNISESFLQFLNCIGWPVQLKHHSGFMGKLNSEICQTASYYEDRNVEFLINVPYFLSLPSSTSQLYSLNKNTDNKLPDDLMEGTLTINKIHEYVTSEDRVCIIWIDQIVNYTSLAKRIKSSSSSSSKIMVYIFIHPLSNTANGLYWIRILIPSLGNTPTSIAASQRLHDNALIFGPLVDGTIVSRHALGAMVRNTAISAHQACRVVTDSYTRPYVIRKQYIEELSAKHRLKLSISERDTTVRL
ncbi:hypothetical protein BJ944DRAFT_236837 [Cunninghamella echinulata]|nr:hypothetical protein BJ944DRAFT_236837 [Cunninghamella echinulata]